MQRERSAVLRFQLGCCMRARRPCAWVALPVRCSTRRTTRATQRCAALRCSTHLCERSGQLALVPQPRSLVVAPRQHSVLVVRAGRHRAHARAVRLGVSVRRARRAVAGQRRSHVPHAEGGVVPARVEAAGVPGVGGRHPRLELVALPAAQLVQRRGRGLRAGSGAADNQLIRASWQPHSARSRFRWGAIHQASWPPTTHLTHARTQSHTHTCTHHPHRTSMTATLPEE
jgi:hypothetical protein